MNPLLPSGCAVYASCAGNMLHNAGFTVRLLRISVRQKPTDDYDGHCVIFWRVDGIVRAYDPEGTVTLPKGITLKDRPIKIARAWAKSADYDRVLGAKEW